MLSLQRPYSLHCDFGSGLFSVPLELSGRKESGLRYASKTNYRTENYQLARHVLENGLAALQVNPDDIQVELFASQQQHIMQFYCSKHLNNAFRFFWKAMGLAYTNPPFSLLAKVLTKIAYEGGRVVMCTPDWGCSGEHAYWRGMVDRMTVGRVQLPDGPIYVPEDSDTTFDTGGAIKAAIAAEEYKKSRKRRTTSKNKAQNRFFRPQKPPETFYAAVWRGQKI